MTTALGSLKLQPSYIIIPRRGSDCQIHNPCHKRQGNPKHQKSFSKLRFVSCSHFQNISHSGLQIRPPFNRPRRHYHHSRAACVQASLAKSLQSFEPLSLSGSTLEGCLHVISSPWRGRRNQIQRFFVLDQSGHEENLDDDINSRREGDLEFCPKRSVLPNDSIETVDESGYVIKVSRELMSMFQYVEKVKRARLKELSETLRQVAYACLFFSCVKGILTPLVEVFKTHPPRWGKLIMVLGAFDAFGITYLALKASQPLERLSLLATECESETNMMGSIEKEEEHMLALAVDLVRLFRRLRDLALCTVVAQFAHILHAMLQLKKSYPNFAIHMIKFVNSWLSTPWM